jgi:hypothetical protein
VNRLGGPGVLQYMSERSAIARRMGARHWPGVLLRAARILAGLTVTAFGVVIFVTPDPAAIGSAGGSESVMLTLFSVILVVGGVVIVVGVEKVNQIAGRNRHASR